ncbi:MAG: hypothetical protein JNK26_03735 [Candidatus Doudnabacteria bacterium]|nr:hypothetical protein [Candidatus Doudnabacteria bacterium]
MAKRRRRKQNLNFKLLLVTAALAAGAYFYSTRPTSVNAELDSALIPERASVADSNVWWQEGFGYRQELSFSLTTGNFVELRFDHAAMVAAGKSNADGSDLHIVAQLNNAADVVPFYLSEINTASTKITFDGKKYPNAKYFLYYGNRKPPSARVLGSSTAESQATPAQLGNIVTPELQISSTRYWQVLQKGKLNLQISIVAPNLDMGPNTRLYYSLGEAEPKLVGKAPNSDGLLDIQLPSPQKGDQTIYLIAVQDGKYTRSNSLNIRISEPVFVAWTIDWEGYNVQDAVLQRIDSIAGRYGLPMTHFFNPRIYVDRTIPEYRRTELTNWVKAREEKHKDEIGMHMHMQYDMVRAAGVEPVTSPRWGSGADGYDVLTSAYSYNQFRAIVQWGLDKFAEYGLPRPAGYRAGGWFASLDTIKALNDLGFIYDSSGRETYKFGSQNRQGLWSLDSKTQPYRPSSMNQNSPTPEPQLNIWEVPNNGNDSYWFPVDHLIGRFYENYATPGEFSSTPKIITYLSHPDWFDVDQPKLEALFTEISKYSLTADKGPVVFTTISSALQEWQ